MENRDCDNCMHRKPNGCESWDCEFKPKGLSAEEVEHYSRLAEYYNKKKGNANEKN